MIALLFWACNPDCPDGPSYDSWASGFFLSKCQPCHSAEVHEMYGAPNIPLESHEDLLEQLDLIKSSVLDYQRMPPGGGLSEDVHGVMIQNMEGLK